MPEGIEERLAAIGVTLPAAAAPAANYVPFVEARPFLFVAGQLPMEGGTVAYCGRIGENLTVEDGVAAARLCAVNLLAQVKAAGALERVTRVVRLGGFVASADAFTGQPQVINGASDLMVAAFGDAGRHARAAVGVNTLPLGAAVEVEGLFLID